MRQGGERDRKQHHFAPGPYSNLEFTGSSAAWTLRTSLEYCSLGAAPPPLWIRHSVGTTCITKFPGKGEMLEATLSVPHSAPCWLGRVTAAYMVCDPSTVIVHHGVPDRRRSSADPIPPLKYSKFGRYTREVSDKVCPHWSVGKLVEVSSEDNTRVGNMGEV